jgi:hypothetical protein
LGKKQVEQDKQTIKEDRHKKTTRRPVLSHRFFTWPLLLRTNIQVICRLSSMLLNRLRRILRSTWSKMTNYKFHLLAWRRSAKLLKPSTGNRLSRLMKLPAIMRIFSVITKEDAVLTQQKHNC